MTTGERIKAYRKKAGMTQAELAQKLGIPFQSISQWERDLRNPKLETLQAIASALGVHIFDLIGIADKLDKYKVEATLPNGEVIQLPDYRDAYNLLPEDKKEEFWKILNSEGDPDELKDCLLDSFSKLNENGQKEAVKRVEELAEIPRYRKEKNPADGE